MRNLLQAILKCLARAPEIEIESRKLLEAINLCDLEKIQKTITKKAYLLNYRSTKYLRLPVELAIENNFIHITKYLLENGANPNIIINDYTKRTLLMQSILDGQLEIITLLLSHGANLDTPDIYGNRALHFAAKAIFGSEIIEILIRHGAKPRLQNILGNTALHIAIKTGSAETMLAILNSDCDLSSTNSKGESALSLVRKKGFPGKNIVIEEMEEQLRCSYIRKAWIATVVRGNIKAGHRERSATTADSCKLLASRFSKKNYIEGIKECLGTAVGAVVGAGAGAGVGAGVSIGDVSEIGAAIITGTGEIFCANEALRARARQYSRKTSSSRCSWTALSNNAGAGAGVGAGVGAGACAGTGAGVAVGADFGTHVSSITAKANSATRRKDQKVYPSDL
jgi:hypothetical protein